METPQQSKSTTSLPQPLKPKTGWQRLKNRPFFIRWSNWEYYPAWLVIIPTAIYYLYLAIRARSWGWFAATNPSIHTGGLIGESKQDIYNLIPPEYLPTNIYVPPHTPIETIEQQMTALGLSFPVIAKPDMGEKGTGVRKLKNREELLYYNQRQHKVPYHVQAFLDMPIEAGVMCYRMPDGSKYGIHSVTLKKFLTITGNGMATFLELVEDNPRAMLTMDRIKANFEHRFAEVLPQGETVELEPIGNHCRGTMFYSGMHLVDTAMTEGFHAITSQIKDVYFCRYDLRCPSIEDLRLGRNIKIMEINGVGAEPAHVYDTAISIWGKYKVLLSQWRIMFDIARMNHQRGVPYMSFSELRQSFKQSKANKQHIEG